MKKIKKKKINIMIMKKEKNDIEDINIREEVKINN